jgi:hypothetical protein
MNERKKYDISLSLRIALIEKELSISQFSQMVGMNRTSLQLINLC